MADTPARASLSLGLADRNAVVFLEGVRVRLDGDRVVYTTGRPGGVCNLPHANTGVLFLGPGSSLTSEAARALAEAGVGVAFVGPGVAPAYMGVLSANAVSDHLARFYPVHADPARGLAALRTVMARRLETVDEICLVRLEELGVDVPRRQARTVLKDFGKAVARAASVDALAREAARFSERLHALHAEAFGLDGARSVQGGAGIAMRLTAEGAGLMSGLAGGVIWALGLPPSLVLRPGARQDGGLPGELAEGFTDAVVLPAAYDFAARTFADETQRRHAFRQEVIARIEAHGLVTRLFDLVEELIGAESPITRAA